MCGGESVRHAWFRVVFFFFFSSRRRHTRSDRDWSSDVCSSDLASQEGPTPMTIPILKLGDVLIASMQSAITDADLTRLQDDLARQVGELQIGRASCRERV